MITASLDPGLGPLGLLTNPVHCVIGLTLPLGDTNFEPIFHRCFVFFVRE